LEIRLLKNASELKQILDLQKSNLPENLSQEELRAEGFVSVKHSLDLLNEMCNPYPHIIAIDNEEVVAYALMMSKKFSQSIPMLKDLFEKIDHQEYKGKFLSQFKYMVMGQICIHKEYRSQGIFRKLYEKMIETLRGEYTYIITEISLQNPRSMQAHKKCGFESLLDYVATDGREWSIVIKEVN